MRGEIGRLARRFVLTLGGELTQSAFHFGFNIALVRMLDPEHYGIFAIVMLIGGVALTYVRALVGMPVSLLVSQRRDTRAARALETSFGSGAILLSAIIAVLVGALLHFWLHADALYGAAFVGLWSLRSYLRTTLLAKHRQAIAGLSDVSLAVAGTVLGLLYLRPGQNMLNTALLLLAGANLVGIAVALLAQRDPLRVTFRPSMRRRFKAIGGQLVWSAIGTTTSNAQAQGVVLLIATFAGPRAYAPIAAMLVLFAPIRLMAVALVNMVQPELASRQASGRLPGFGKMMLLWTAFAGAIGATYGLVAAAALPMMGSAVFEGQPRAVIGLMVWGLTNAYLLSVMPRILLEILRKFRLIALISGVSGGVGMAVVAAMLATTSPAWALSGNVLAETLVLVWSSVAVARALRAPATRSTVGPGREALFPRSSGATRLAADR